MWTSREAESLSWKKRTLFSWQKVQIPEPGRWPRRARSRKISKSWPYCRHTEPALATKAYCSALRAQEFVNVVWHFMSRCSVALLYESSLTMQPTFRSPGAENRTPAAPLGQEPCGALTRRARSYRPSRARRLPQAVTERAPRAGAVKATRQRHLAHAPSAVPVHWLITPHSHLTQPSIVRAQHAHPNEMTQHTCSRGNTKTSWYAVARGDAPGRRRPQGQTPRRRGEGWLQGLRCRRSARHRPQPHQAQMRPPGSSP
jgi:hypothetical protein